MRALKPARDSLPTLERQDSSPHCHRMNYIPWLGMLLGEEGL